MKYNEDYNEHREKNSPRECKHYQTSSRYRQTHHEKTRSTVLGPQAAFLVIQTYDLPKNPKENFKMKRNSRWPTTRTLDLPSSPRSMGGPYR